MVSVSTVLGRGRKVYAFTWYEVICSHKGGLALNFRIY